MNREVRKKELLKITLENQQLLKRLQDKTSNYSVAKWEEDFRTKERIMKNMCEYPIIFDDRNLQSAGDQYSSEGPPISRGGLNLPRVNTTQNGSRGINQSFTVDKAS